jgi:hypothetical protein
MTNPFASSSFRYTIRAETRPEGRDAVERQTVSGWCTPFCWARVNQLWNWVKGEESSWERERAALVYWSAWEFVLSFAGATA